jgi:hypothetical protein
MSALAALVALGGLAATATVPAAAASTMQVDDPFSFD